MSRTYKVECECGTGPRALRQVKDDVEKLLKSIDKKYPQDFRDGKQIFEAFTGLALELQLQTVSQQQLFHFLSSLSHEHSRPFRLF